MAAVDQHCGVVCVKVVCEALTVVRETYYRRTRPRQAGPLRRRRHSPTER
jgi:hypothetical protein